MHKSTLNYFSKSILLSQLNIIFFKFFKVLQHCQIITGKCWGNLENCEKDETNIIKDGMQKYKKIISLESKVSNYRYSEVIAGRRIHDKLANYMILSLQTDQMSPAINVRPKYFSLHSRYFHPSPRKARLTTRRWRLWSLPRWQRWPRWRGTASPTCSCWGAWPSPATSSSSSSGRRRWEGLFSPPAFSIKEEWNLFVLVSRYQIHTHYTCKWIFSCLLVLFPFSEHD